MTDLLAGVRVIDFTHVHAGPLCTYQLALMGADVIKVEAPGSGDQMRAMGPQLAPGMSPGFLGQNANKRSIAVDLKAEAGLAVVHGLIRTADVLVINMRPGTAGRLGIDYDAARKINPRIVYCAISGYGQSGPEADRPAFDHLIQGESGMFHATGTPEQPVRVGFAVADAGTAVIASSAINGALLRRERTGAGAFLDVSMLESCMTLMGLNYYGFLATGRVGRRVGPQPLAGVGSAGTFETADGTLMVNANSHRLFVRLAQTVGRSDLLEDERFATPAAAQQNRVVLRKIFADLFATDTAEHWDGVLREGGVPAGIAKTPPETVRHPQLAHRGSLATLSGVPGVDELTVLGAGFTVDESPTTPECAPPLLGEHTDEILAELGADAEALRAQGVVA
ncbi:MAG: CoA transferase [Gammaproteobacteria bacterium]|nr:CoA transferase [Gammaproteobacteria bacterium]